MHQEWSAKIIVLTKGRNGHSGSGRATGAILSHRLLVFVIDAEGARLDDRAGPYK
jgi:hypothetical protein